MGISRAGFSAWLIDRTTVLISADGGGAHSDRECGADGEFYAHHTIPYIRTEQADQESDPVAN